jgi:hypothetical protein
MLASCLLAGGSVAMVWVNLAVSRRWKPERDWVETLAIVLGVCWVVLGLLLSLPLVFLG